MQKIIYPWNTCPECGRWCKEHTTRITTQHGKTYIIAYNQQTQTECQRTKQPINNNKNIPLIHNKLKEYYQKNKTRLRPIRKQEQKRWRQRKREQNSNALAEQKNS